MLGNFWKNKLEEEKNLESLQNLYEDEVMKYKLRKAAGEQYYSTIFKPITGKLEETIEPLKQLKELSEEQSKRMLELPPVPLAREEEEDDDEFKDVPEPEEEGAVGGVEETRDRPKEIKIPKVPKFNIDKGLDIEDIRKRGFKLLSEYIGEKDDAEIEKAIRQVSNSINGQANITKEINKLNDQVFNLEYIIEITEYKRVKKESKNELKEVKDQIEDLEKEKGNLEN